MYILNFLNIWWNILEYRYLYTTALIISGLLISNNIYAILCGSAIYFVIACCTTRTGEVQARRNFICAGAIMGCTFTSTWTSFNGDLIWPILCTCTIMALMILTFWHAHKHLQNNPEYQPLLEVTHINHDYSSVKFTSPSPNDIETGHVPCAICLENFKNGEELASLNDCKHQYHKSCIESWLVRKRICPQCRQPTHPVDNPINNSY